MYWESGISMIEKGIEIITDWLISCGEIEKTDKELYSYALYSFLLSISPFILALCFGGFMGCVNRSVVIVLPFVLIRKYSGGFHAKKLRSCLCGSSLLLLLCIEASFLLKVNWCLLLLVFISAISLIIFSPLDNNNRPLSQEDNKHCKHITAIIVVVVLLIGILFIVINVYTYTLCLYIGIVLSAVLQIPCIFGRIAKRYQKRM